MGHVFSIKGRILIRDSTVVVQIGLPNRVAVCQSSIFERLTRFLSRFCLIQIFSYHVPLVTVITTCKVISTTRQHPKTLKNYSTTVRCATKQS